MSLADTVPRLPVGYQEPVGLKRTPGQSSRADADSSVQRNVHTPGASPLDQAFSQAMAAANGNGVHVQVCVCCINAHTLCSLLFGPLAWHAQSVQGASVAQRKHLASEV